MEAELFSRFSEISVEEGMRMALPYDREMERDRVCRSKTGITLLFLNLEEMLYLEKNNLEEMSYL